MSRVAGKTGDVTLTAADVGLSDLPGRVQSLEGRAQLDVEAVQDILGQMLGESQGHYDDAAGTYQINLPTGSSMTDEQVQDIVGALIRAGTGATANYDDAAGTLTISAAGSTLPGGGQDGYVLTKDSRSSNGNASWQPTAAARGIRLRMIPAQIMRFADPNFGNFGGNGTRPTFQFLATQGITFRRLMFYARLPGELTSAGSRGILPGATVTVKNNSGAVLAAGKVALPANDSVTENICELENPVSIGAGQAFTVDIYDPARNQTICDIGFGPGALTKGGEIKFVGSPGIEAGPTFYFQGSDASPKEVSGPLDPADFPLSTVADAAAQSGFMVVDDAAKTASLYWKFSDGSTKKLDLI